MPVTKSAIKKLKQDKKRTGELNIIKNTLKKVLTKAKRGKTETAIRKAFSEIDKAVKLNIIHKNKAARLKSQLMKKAQVKQAEKTKPTRKTRKTSKNTKIAVS